MDTTTTRRSALGIIATCPIAMIPALTVMQCSTPADAATPSAFQTALDRYKAAENALNATTLNEDSAEYKELCDRYGAADDALCDVETTTALQFVEKFEALWRDGGNPGRERVNRIVRQAQRLLNREA